MIAFPRLAADEGEHRRLVLSLLWRYGPKAPWVAERALHDTEAGVFASPSEAIARYNESFDSIHTKREPIECP